MKKLLVSCVVACLFALPSFAQQNNANNRQAEYAEWQQKVKNEVKLTDDQMARWDALDAEYKDKMTATMQNTSLDKDAQKTKMIELRKEKNAKFLELLTAEQQTKYNEVLDKMKKEAAAGKSN